MTAIESRRILSFSSPRLVRGAEGRLSGIGLADLASSRQSLDDSARIVLPRPAFVGRERWTEKRIGAMAIYCSDGRWGDALDEFCHCGLGIPAYDRFAVPGGPAWLCAGNVGQGLSDTTREQIEFLVSAHELRRIVLITHFGCAFYRHRLGGSSEQCVQRQIDDVSLALDSIEQTFPAVRAQGYLAMQRQGVVSFHAIGG
jgi:hypothetical protein